MKWYFSARSESRQMRLRMNLPQEQRKLAYRALRIDE